jgi:hypothetical protein
MHDRLFSRAAALWNEAAMLPAESMAPAIHTLMLTHCKTMHHTPAYQAGGIERSSCGILKTR